MKNGNFWIKLVSLAVIIGCLLYYQSVAVTRAETVAENEAKISEVENYNKEIRKMMQEKEEEPAFRDGVYRGEAEGYGGTISLSVVVESGRIDAIEVLDHSREDPAYYMLAESVLDTILKQQDPEADTVSGATFSSAGLIRAVQDALSDAEIQ